VSYRAIIKKDKRYVWIWNLFIFFISVKGTNFDHSTLDDASFIHADVKGSRFVGSTITRTNWKGVLNFDCSRIVGSYLDNLKIRYLLVKRKVTKKDKKYQNMDLSRLNLVEADLEGVDLSKSDLSNSQLTNTILRGSILSQTRLDNVDLSGANITGTTIEERSIPTTAKLDGLICEFFYPESNPTKPYPSYGKLTSKEAIELLKQPLETVDLIFTDGIDWKAFLSSFNKLKTKYGKNNLDVQAIEHSKDGSLVIKLEVPPVVL